MSGFAHSDPADFTLDDMLRPGEEIPGTPREDDGDEFDLMQDEVMGNETVPAPRLEEAA